MVATSVPGTAVAGRARSDAFARLLDTGTLTDAPDSTEASPGQTEAAAPVRGLLNRSASLLKPDAPAPQITTAPKPNPPDRTQVKPPARAKHELKANGKKPQTDQPSVTTAAQPELSPTTATPIVEARPPSNASTTPTRAAPEDIAAVQYGPVTHRAAAPHADEPQPSPSAAKPEQPAQPAPARQSDGSVAALPAAPVTTTAQPLPTALMAHAPEPVAKTEAASRISAPSPTTAPATQAAAQAPTAAVPAIAVTAHLTNPQHLTIHLTPPELGKLEVRIDRPTDAPARVEIKVEHAHTLDLLSQDQPKLQQALDQAGVPAQRQLVLTLSDNGGGSNGSNADRRAASASRPEPDASDAAATGNEPPYAPRWVQSALDITA